MIREKSIKFHEVVNILLRDCENDEEKMLVLTFMLEDIVGLLSVVIDNKTEWVEFLKGGLSPLGLYVDKL